LNAEKFEGVQRRAIKQLESIGPPRAKDAIPALEKFRDSTPNEELKKAAAEALAKIQN
jgi:HEAT repeat protein